MSTIGRRSRIVRRHKDVDGDLASETGEGESIANSANYLHPWNRLAELQSLIIGESPALAAIRQLVLEVAPTRASVMIYGESGTGKELVARAIHRLGKQATGPFVPVNIG